MSEIKKNTPTLNPGYFVFHGRIPMKGKKEKIKAMLRVRFDHHLNQFMDSLTDLE